jgi:AraC-like DNA-binding protein
VDHESESRPASAVDAWVRLVLTCVNSPDDPARLADWAAFAGMSVSTLRQRCYVANVPPRSSLLFARLLRAVVRVQGQPWDARQWLFAADSRTLTALVSKAGMPLRAQDTPSISSFLETQVVLGPEAPAMKD